MITLTEKDGDRAQFCYTDMDGLIIHIKIKDILEDIRDYSEKRFPISNYKIQQPLQIGNLIKRSLV